MSENEFILTQVYRLQCPSAVHTTFPTLIFHAVV